MKRFLLVVLLVASVVLPLTAVAPADDGAQESAFCAYCDLPACGCFARDGCYVVFTCSCSDIDCKRTCRPICPV